MKIVISGYYGYDNLGDEAILQGIIHSLRRQSNNLKITVLSARPEVTSRRYQVQAVGRNDIKAVIKEIFHSDLLISGGGSLLQDITSWRSIPYYLGLVFIAWLFGKKTVFYAQGVGPVNGRIGRFLVSLIGNRVDLITVRDEASRKLLLELGVNPDLIEVTIDPVFSLSDRFSGKGIKLMEEAGIEIDGPLLGISVRPWNNNDYLEKVARAADYLLELTGGQVVIIPMHYHQDQEISRNLQEMMEKESYILSGNYTPAEMLGIFSELDFLLGVRLHSLIFAAINQVPFVAISYDPKIDSFLEVLGIRSQLDIDELDTEMMKRVVEISWQNRQYFADGLKEKAEQFAELTAENAEMVLKL